MIIGRVFREIAILGGRPIAAAISWRRTVRR